MPSPNISTDVPKSGKIAHNPELCRGCKMCELACSAYHDGMCSAHLSRIHVVPDDLALEFPAPVCNQCQYPSCYYACPKKDKSMCIDSKTGARYINEDECLRCGKCARACPFTPSLIWHIAEDTKKRYYKCDLCRNREEGPFCVEVCPRNALTFISKGQEK
jgi:Fe-S-cluster-containing hydrogenase component 2